MLLACPRTAQLSLWDLLIGIFSGRVGFGLVFLLRTRLWVILLVRIIPGRGVSGESQERKNQG